MPTYRVPGLRRLLDEVVDSLRGETGTDFVSAERREQAGLPGGAYVTELRVLSNVGVGEMICNSTTGRLVRVYRSY